MTVTIILITVTCLICNAAAGLFLVASELGWAELDSDTSTTSIMLLIFQLNPLLTPIILISRGSELRRFEKEKLMCGRVAGYSQTLVTIEKGTETTSLLSNTR